MSTNDNYKKRGKGGLKKVLITTGWCLLFAVLAFGQNKPPSKVEIKAAKVENAVQSGRYAITVNQVSPMSGSVRPLTPDYSVRISGDSAYVYLPYFGRAYSAPMSGEGGIRVSTTMDSYKVVYKKGKNYSIRFTAKGVDDTYQFSITLWTNGKASIHVTCNNRQAIDYSGELVLIDG
jgi:hypothetical protein